MSIPCHFHDHSMPIPWLFHDYYMPWLFHDYSITISWFFHDYSMTIPFHHNFMTMVRPWLCHDNSIIQKQLHHHSNSCTNWAPEHFHTSFHFHNACFFNSTEASLATTQWSWMVTVATTSMVSLASLDEILGVRTCFCGDSVSVEDVVEERGRERSVFKQAAHASKWERKEAQVTK